MKHLAQVICRFISRLLAAGVGRLRTFFAEDPFQSEYFEFASEADAVESKAELQPVPDEVDDGMVYYCRRGVYHGRQIVLKGVHAKGVIRHAYGISPARTIWNAPIPDTNYIAEVIVPEAGEDRVMRSLRKAVDEEFGIEASLVKRSVPVLELTNVKGQTIRFPKSDGSTIRYRWDGEGSLSGEGMKLGTLRYVLEIAMGKPVVKPFSSDQRFNIELQWEKGNIEDLQSKLEQQGLQLTPTEEEIQVLVVNKSEGKITRSQL